MNKNNILTKNMSCVTSSLNEENNNNNNIITVMYAMEMEGEMSNTKLSLIVTNNNHEKIE